MHAQSPGGRKAASTLHPRRRRPSSGSVDISALPRDLAVEVVRKLWHYAEEKILDGLNIRAEYEALGVVFLSDHPDVHDRLPCHAAGHPDGKPSCSVQVGWCSGWARGRYFEADDVANMTLWEFAARHGRFADWRKARKHYAEVAGVKLPSGREPKRPENQLGFPSFRPATPADKAVDGLGCPVNTPDTASLPATPAGAMIGDLATSTACDQVEWLCGPVNMPDTASLPAAPAGAMMIGDLATSTARDLVEWLSRLIGREPAGNLLRDAATLAAEAGERKRKAAELFADL
jgi:hypothetical protein